MTEENSTEELGPPRISFATFLLKVLAGAAGGIGGALILGVIFFLASSIFEPLTEGFSDEAAVSPIFVFLLMIMIFISTTIGNIVSTWLLALTEKDKYKRISSAIYQVFIISVIIFILMVPVYFITSATNIGIMAYAIAMHIIIAAQVSVLILEIVSNYRYSLLGVYGVTFSILVSATILFAMAGIVRSPQLLLFIALPIVWGSIAVVHSIVTVLYGWVVRIYDKDFLSTQTVYGQDYGKEVEDEEPQAPKAKDEAGGDFLRHN